MASVLDILNSAPPATALANNAIGKAALFGKKLDMQLPIKIYAYSKVLQKIYDNSGIVGETNAIGYIEPTSVGDDGDVIEVFVNDPELGVISLGSYEKDSTDTDTLILASHISDVLEGNIYGYVINNEGTPGLIDINARPGIGGLINGGSNLRVEITPAPVFSPLDLPNVWLFVESDIGVTGTTDVTAWADQGPEGNDLFYRINEPELQTNVINGFPVIQKTSSTSSQLRTLNPANLPTSVPITIYVVAAQRPGDADGVFIASNQVSNNNIAIFRSSSTKISAKVLSTTTLQCNGTIADNTFYTIRSSYNGNTQYLAINNGTPASVVPTGISDTPAVLNLFTLNNGSDQGDKRFAAVLICTEFHDAPTVTKVENYFRTKYAHY